MRALVAFERQGQLAPIEYTREQVELIKRTICRGASDDELTLFLHVCKRTGLDPLVRQIYAIKRRESVDGQWQDRMTFQTSIDGYALVADRTGRYAPGREPTFVYDERNALISATAYIKKQTDDGTWHEVARTAHYSEYVALKRDGNPTKMWAEKPHIMLAKCAEALALRRAFPAELSGVYTAEEMDRSNRAGEEDEQPLRPAKQVTAQPAPAPPPEQQTPTEPPLSEDDQRHLADLIRAAAQAAGANVGQLATEMLAALGCKRMGQLRVSQYALAQQWLSVWKAKATVSAPPAPVQAVAEHTQGDAYEGPLPPDPYVQLLQGLHRDICARDKTWLAAIRWQGLTPPAGWAEPTGRELTPAEAAAIAAFLPREAAEKIARHLKPKGKKAPAQQPAPAA